MLIGAFFVRPLGIGAAFIHWLKNK
jgi:hypothetical protein